MVDFHKITDVAGSLLPHGTTKDLINSGGLSLLEPTSPVTKLMAEIAKASGITSSNQFKIMINLPTGHSAFSAGDGTEWLPGVADDGIAMYKLDKTSSARQIVMSCETSSIPGRSLNSAKVKYYGPEMKHAYSYLYPEIDMVFRVHNNMMERKFFEAWQECAVSSITNDANYYDEYVADIVIAQYGPPEAKTGLVESLLEGKIPTLGGILSQGAGVAKSFGKNGQKAAKLFGIANAAFNVFGGGSMPDGKKIAQYTLFNAYPKMVSPLILDHAAIGYHKQNIQFEYKNWKTDLSLLASHNASFVGGGNIIDNILDSGIQEVKNIGGKLVSQLPVGNLF
jgi:hypothetical protein